MHSYNSSPVAIVTGASSGIGLAITHHLLHKGWYVILADVNPPSASTNALPLSTSKYIPCDVSSWDSQASLFEQAYAGHGRLDFVALNAGIDDRDDIFDSLDAQTSPREPNMDTFNVNLIGVYYGIKLAANYMARNSKPGGKIVITSSSAGLYALPAVPQYTATKHALVGLVRALAPKAVAKGVTINALCPAMVATNLAPPGLMDHFSKEQVTPMSSMLRAYDELMDDEKCLNGQILEVSLSNLWYREEIAAQGEGKMRTDKAIAAAWDQAYRDRNVAFALRDWKSGRKDKANL